MKINSINNYKFYNTGIHSKQNSSPVTKIQNNAYRQSFKGVPLNKLYEEYNWYINCDKIPAVNSFLKINAPKDVMDEFLTHILNTKDRGFEFINSIVFQPRNMSEIFQKLKEKLKDNSELLNTFMFDKPYYKAYESYLESRYNNANTLSELLRIRPDWKGSVLMEKFTKLNNSDNLTIGIIPKQIGKNHLYQIVDYLSGKMESGIKPDKKIDNLVLDGKTYEFKYFTEGKSSKNVFGVFVPSECKKFVIKMDDTKKRSLDEPFALGTLAKIDGYLTTNRSRNSAPLCFYDHDRNFSVYKYIEHDPIHENANDIEVIKEKLPDFKSLGLNYNDTVGYKNFFALSERACEPMEKTEGFEEALSKSEWISVDNDHVTYENILQPMVFKFNSSLPNAMGMFF